jgi:hypothetical protein
MKLIIAIIPPEHFNQLLDDLDEQHLPGLTVSEARGFGQNDRDFTDVEMPPKLRLEIACLDEEAETSSTPSTRVPIPAGVETGKSLCCPSPMSFASRPANVVQPHWERFRPITKAPRYNSKNVEH